MLVLDRILVVKEIYALLSCLSRAETGVNKNKKRLREQTGTLIVLGIYLLYNLSTFACILEQLALTQLLLSVAEQQLIIRGRKA